MSRRKKYQDYDYEEIYDKKILGEESVEDAIARGKKMTKKVMVKTIQAGDILEAEIYPAILNIPVQDRTRKKKTREQQKNLNDKNTRKTVVRFVQENFQENDLFVTLPYEDYCYPDYKQAKKDIRNYILRVKRYRKKNGLPELKYLYVISFLEPGEETKKVRMHHHIIMNKMDRDVAEQLWNKSKRVSAKRLKPDNYGLEGIARYIAGNSGRRRWAKSRNLRKPKEHKSVSKLSMRKLHGLAMDQAVHKEVFEKMYKGRYRFLDSQIFYSDIVGNFYVYARMRKQI